MKDPWQIGEPRIYVRTKDEIVTVSVVSRGHSTVAYLSVAEAYLLRDLLTGAISKIEAEAEAEEKAAAQEVTP